MLNGWQTKTAQELDATIQTWGEIFNRYEIPLDAYQELYRLAFDTRQTKMQLGGDVPMMDATLFVSQWTGANGLKAERRQRQIDTGRTLAENAQSVCKFCGGSGWRQVGEGRNAPVERCDHL